MIPNLFVRADFDKYLWENEIWSLFVPAIDDVSSATSWSDMKHDKEQSSWAMAHQTLRLVKQRAEEEGLLHSPEEVQLFNDTSVKMLQRFYVSFERLYRQGLIGEGGPIADSYLKTHLESEEGVLEAISKLEGHYGLIAGSDYKKAIELYIADLLANFSYFIKKEVEWPDDVWNDESTGNGVLFPLFESKARHYLGDIVDTYIKPSSDAQAIAREYLKKEKGPSWGELMVHSPDTQDAIDSIIASATVFDELGCKKTSDLLDCGIKTIAQTPGGQISHVTDVTQAIANLASNMLLELQSLKEQNLTAIPPAILLEFQQGNHALGENIAKLQTLIKDR